jgi:hypothetical protein
VAEIVVGYPAQQLDRVRIVDARAIQYSRLKRGSRARAYCKSEKTDPVTGRPFEGVAGALFG